MNLTEQIARSQPRLKGRALHNYLNYRYADCVGGNFAYAPLLEHLRKTHGVPTRTVPLACVPILTTEAPCIPDNREAQPPEVQPTALAVVQDILTATTGVDWWPWNAMLPASIDAKLATIRQLHGRRLFSSLGLRAARHASPDEMVHSIYPSFRAFCAQAHPPLQGMRSLLRALDSLMAFYLGASPSGCHLCYGDFSAAALDILIQPGIDCCLFNGRSRHRAATVAFLAHPATHLHGIHDTARQSAVGATIEADMIAASSTPVRVLDSVEIGDVRNRLGVRYGWIPMVLHGVLERIRTQTDARALFVNTGYEPAFGQGYLSHESARELAEWIRRRFPVVRVPLRLKYGLDPLRAIGATDPRINLEVLATKARNDMFNHGEGHGIGVWIDVDRPDDIRRLSCTQMRHLFGVDRQRSIP